MKAIIRNAKADEGKILAAIEGACFPPAEAASEESVCERLKAFPENFCLIFQSHEPSQPSYNIEGRQ